MLNSCSFFPTLAATCSMHVTPTPSTWRSSSPITRTSQKKLGEFYLSFFDFDQDYADGDFAFVRETLLAFDFHTVFVEEGSEVERRFTKSVSLFSLSGGIPTNTVPETFDGSGFINSQTCRDLGIGYFMDNTEPDVR